MTEKKWCLYRHISPSGKVYIGITSKRPYIRWGLNGNNYISSRAFYNAILKYGWDNIKHEVLFLDLGENKAKELEMSLISHYKKLGISYNITDGGQGTLGLTKTLQQKEVLRMAHLGKKLSQETRKKMSEVRKGKPGTMLGKKHSESTKIKMSLAKSGELNPQYGKRRTEEQKLVFRLAQKTRKAVAKVDPVTDEIIEQYNSINEAAKILRCSPSHLSECCRGKKKLFNNYKWIFI